MAGRSASACPERANHSIERTPTFLLNQYTLMAHCADKAQDCVAAGISIGAIMRDGAGKSKAMVARYIEHLQVKQGASAILAARQARL